MSKITKYETRPVTVFKSKTVLWLSMLRDIKQGRTEL